MKILTITTDPNAGGSSISLLNLLEGLKERGHEIMVVLPKKGFLSERLQKLEIPYVILPTIKPSIWPPIKSLLHLILFVPLFLFWQICHFITKKKLKSIIKSYHPDIIHSNVSLFSIGYKAAKEVGIKHVWHIREYGDLDFNLKVYPSKVKYINNFNHSYCISITKGIKEHFNLSDNCITIYNGIKPKDYHPKKQKKEDYFLFVGHVNENKGVTDLVKAFILYRESGGANKLIIVGSYKQSYKDKLLTLLRMHDQESNVEFLGQRSDIDNLMQRAKALIVPSKYEAFGRITAEGMFNNCMVVGRNTGGTREQIELGEKECGKKMAFLFNDIEELKQILIKIDILDWEDYYRITEMAQKFACNNFSNEINTELTEQYFNTVINYK